MKVVRSVVVTLVMLSAACAAQNGPLSGDAFSLVGLVVDVDDDAAPVGVPHDEDLDDKASPESPGAMIVRSQDGPPAALRDCDPGEREHTVFFNAQTDFDPEKVVEERGFPDGLVGSTVDIRGVVYPNPARDEGSSCNIVGRRVAVLED